jgi:hypothetical protein
MVSVAVYPHVERGRAGREASGYYIAGSIYKNDAGSVSLACKGVPTGR